LLDGDLVREDDLAFFVRQLGTSEALRYGSFIRRARQRQFLLGRMLLRFAISDFTGLPPNVIGIVERPDNAPQLIFPESKCSPNFSLSHSRNWISCVVSADAMVGVDIEVNYPGRDFVASSQLAFHPNDYLWLLSQPAAGRRARVGVLPTLEPERGSV
jgi:4'-phosphopantetheinyl transferase